MKIRHKPPANIFRSATLTPEYQAEVDRSMARGRQRWEAEQAALEKAERRRARLAANLERDQARATSGQAKKKVRATRREIAELDEQIEMYRAHLQSLQRIMTSHGASSTHRGVKSYRPVPKQGDVV